MKKILIIQTGGTIAMDISGANLPELDPARWSEVIYKEVPELSKIAEIEMARLFFEDSSDLHREHWGKLIQFINEKYEAYHGFVILHGTDTMAYTASALSFGLQNLAKPVIMTGSQVPMSNIRSDARRNLVNAIEIATLPVHEIAICFNDHVYRGNRSTKMSIGDFDAFASPNAPHLAEIGLDIELHASSSPAKQAAPLHTFTAFSDRVFLLKLYPSLDPSFLDRIELSGLRALIVEAFGSGNFPVNGAQSLLPFFRKCIRQNMMLVFTSQAAYDAVDLTKYESGRKALEIGALSAKDMTVEATLTKMMYLLGNYSANEKIITLFQTNIAGELTE